MKRINFLLLIAGLILFGSVDVSAQKWLDKAMKKVDKALTKVDDTLTKVDDGMKGIAEKKIENADYTGATIKCTNANFNIQLASCIRDGELTTITYYITNKGSDVTIEYWGRMSMPDKQTNTAILDSEGNEYKWFDLSVGKEHYNGSDWLPTLNFPSDVKKKCTIVIKNVAKSAKQLKRVTISGWDFFLQFNNVPIYLPVDILSKDKAVFAKEKPVVDGINAQNDLKWAITNVAITEKNTQITAVAQQPNVSYNNNSPEFDPNAVITINGKEYALLEAYGVPKYYFYGYNFTSAGQTRQYYFIFEKIPESTEVFDMKFENIAWKNIWLVDPPKPAVGTFTLTNKGVACLKKGSELEDVPRTCPGFYDRFEVDLIEDEEAGYHEINFYVGKEIVAMMYAPRFLRDYTVEGITIYSSNVSTPEGVHPGMLIKDFLNIKGAKFDSRNYGVYLAINDYTIGYNPEDLTVAGKKVFDEAYSKGLDVKFSTSYFKESAKVTSIYY
jgi:hypothetical protein